MDEPMRGRVRGIAVIWLLVTAVVLIGFLGLVIDSGYAYLTASQLQSAADAAALAAAAQLRSTGDTSAPIAKAQEIALLNTAATKPVVLASSDVVCGRYYRPGDSTDKLGFYPAETPLNAVQVTARRTTDSPDRGVPLFFGHIFGVSTVNVTRSAIAMTSSKAPGLIVLDPNHTEGSLKFGVGKVVLNVEGGTITVNSSDPKAVLCNVNVQIIATELNIVGGYHGLPGEPLPIIHTGVAPVADPLAGLPVPPNGPLGTRNDDTRTFTPGYFPNGIHIGDSPDNKPWTFQPGLYIVDQGNRPPIGFSIGGRNCMVNGDGVTIVVNTGKLSISDAATVNFTPPTSGDYAGISLISFFQAAEGATASIGGQSHVHIKGLIYVPHGLTKIGGSATDYDATQIICYRLQLEDAVHVSVPLGPRAGGTGHSFLVK